jgi:hypothetical protein
MLECTLVQYPNENIIQLKFNRSFTNKVVRIDGYSSFDEKAPKRLKVLRKRLKFLAHGARIRIETAGIFVESDGGCWDYFLPQVIAYLKNWWKEDFTVRYTDERRPYEHYGEMGENIREIEIKPIEYGIEFISRREPAPFRRNSRHVVRESERVGFDDGCPTTATLTHLERQAEWVDPDRQEWPNPEDLNGE